MLAEVTGGNCNWLCTGQQFFSAMEKAINEAQQSVCLEMYIFAPGLLGERFRRALVSARSRGVRVQVLIDALGSYSLPGNFWEPLQATGGEVRRFNPLSLHRLGIRDHRKMLVCDERVAFVGGFNIAPEYDGDGVGRGWCDIGLEILGPLARQLAAAFYEMFSLADFQHKKFIRFRRSPAKKQVVAPYQQLLLSGPGRGLNPIKRALRKDLSQARSAQFMVAYFLPPWSLRRQLVHLAQRGARVQLLLAGRSDVALSLLAARSVYRRLLKGAVEIYEYQPQILHAKLFIIDDVVYVGSANLDQRSLNINYELMVRLHSPEIAAQARGLFQENLRHCSQVNLEEWQKSRSPWRRFKEYWAYLLLVRVDPYIARRQWRGLPDE